MKLENKVVAVAGLGVTGRAVSDVLLARGAHVLGVDAAAESKNEDLAALLERGLEVTARDFDIAAAREWLTEKAPELVVASPGWRPTTPLLQAARASQIPIWSEAELAWHLRSARGPQWLAVTGTNGKTTVVRLLEAILTAAGRSAQAVGNIGEPLITAALNDDLEFLAVELSSFQLHHTFTMAPLASALLNIAPDHLDWHGSYAKYRAAKAKIFERTRQVCLYNTADFATEEILRAADVAPGARAVGITLAIPTLGTLGIVEGHLYDRAFNPQRRTSAQEIGALGDLVPPASAGTRPEAALRQLPAHLVEDALFAAGLALAAGIEPAEIAAGLRAFSQNPSGRQHRGERVAVHNDVAFVNNSKATNPHAAQAAFSGLPSRSAVWIAGGASKGANLEDLVAQVSPQLRAVVLIGRQRAQLSQILARHAPDLPVIEIDEAQNKGVDQNGARAAAIMDRAVRAAQQLAHPSDTVLLAPACASQDQFDSYVQRGELFSAAAQKLAAEEGGAN